jgi:16S rRNA A1518/A1519 N6-dimethyltransferase RsmA/KsgA/DIM1 with predicted DNA glycosylase/AP lyase activity
LPLVRAKDGFFDERVAAIYDESSAQMFDPSVVEPTVDFLADLTGTGRALELGIGTGRIALPLAARGVEVHGIELSQAMVGQLRAKAGGERQHQTRVCLGATGSMPAVIL